MGVYIKGMEMPSSCADCKLRMAVGCCGNLPHNTRMPDCPLNPVPPHGRLIDADAVTKAAMENILMWEEVGYDRDAYRAFLANYIDDAPTIIPAEEVE